MGVLIGEHVVGQDCVVSHVLLSFTLTYTCQSHKEGTLIWEGPNRSKVSLGVFEAQRCTGGLRSYMGDCTGGMHACGMHPQAALGDSCSQKLAPHCTACARCRSAVRAFGRNMRQLKPLPLSLPCRLLLLCSAVRADATALLPCNAAQPLPATSQGPASGHDRDKGPQRAPRHGDSHPLRDAETGDSQCNAGAPAFSNASEGPSVGLKLSLTVLGSVIRLPAQLCTANMPLAWRRLHPAWLLSFKSGGSQHANPP